MKKVFQFLSISALLLVSAEGMRAQCTPNFTYNVGSGGVVNFVNTSVGTSSTTMFYWNMGNGTYSTGLNLQTASATYTTNGSYQVTLWLTDTINQGPCNGYFTDTILVNTAGCNDILGISHFPQANGLVNFQTTLSTPQVYTAQSWNFGDGGTSSSVNPAHTYSASGLYLVSVSSTVGICTYTASKTISVSLIPCNLNASFSYTLGSNGSAQFMSTSTGVGSGATFYWYFGDGTNGVGPSVTHTYNASSNYFVILAVNDSLNFFGCKDTAGATVNISNGPCLNSTTFSMSKDTVQTLTWNAMPNYPSNVTAVSWSWGDGSSSSGFYPSHTYSAAGFYSICVSTTLSCGNPTTVCWAGNIYRPSSGSGNSPMVTVNVLNPNTAVGITQSSRENSTLRFYPSPVADVLTIDGLKDGSASVRILNSIGKLVRAEQFETLDNGKTSVDVSNLAAGIYYMQVENNGNTENVKLIKQ